MANIGIIGGGYTGLTAAYELTKAGHKVEILERAPEVGGLAAGFQIAGGNIEKTYHHLFRTDTDILSFCTELGIANKIEWHSSSIEIYYQGKLYNFTTPLDLLKFRPLPFFSRIRTAFVALYLNRIKDGKRFARISAYDWMKKYAGKASLQVIWEPLLKGKFDKFYHDISMAWLWARLHIRSNSRKAGELGEKLAYFTGGFATFTSALQQKVLEQGGTITTSIEVRSIKASKSGVSVETDSGVRSFDKLLATVPSGVFVRLVTGDKAASQEYLNRLNSVDYLGAAVLVFASEQSIGKSYWYNINDLSMPFLVFIHHTNLIDKANYGGKEVYYIGSYVPHEHKYFSMSEDDLLTLWYKGLQKIFPDFDRRQITEQHLFRLKNAQHIVTTDYEEKIPAMQTPLENVYLSNFSQIYPEDRGTNYAVREGRKVAKLILQDLQS